MGSRWPLGTPGVVASVRQTGRPARIEDDERERVTEKIAAVFHATGARSAVACPIVVEGRVWGAMVLLSPRNEPLPASTEARLTDFAELVATAIANTASREALAALADEQAALRRVALLVAQHPSPREVFPAVTEAVGLLLGADIAALHVFSSDGTATTMAAWSGNGGGGPTLPIGSRVPLDGDSVAVRIFKSGAPARIDSYAEAKGDGADLARSLRLRSTVGAPILVDGKLWGALLASTRGVEPWPHEAESRIAAFTELVATAIANAQSKSELTASRRRIVAAADEARRRIERDLHDGIQQRLVALSFRARAMTRRPPDELAGMAAELSEGLKDASDELREISRGIHPTILTEAGLGPALRALARRSDIPVIADARLDERLPTPVEAAAYYVASEALTNVLKHANASVVELIAAHDDHVLTLEVRDDGIGGVDACRVSGIVGLTDRVEALGGTISIASPPRGGTTLSVRIPTAT
jgi:signal transduction histidine kinase